MNRIAGLIIATALAATAQQPDIYNGRLQAQPAGANLETTLKAFIAAQSSPAWIGYAVPVVPGERQICGWDNNHREPSRQMSLEGPTSLFVLYRVERNEIGKVRISTPDCRIDAGGLQVTWLTGVNPEQSVRYLQAIATSAPDAAAKARDRFRDSAVSAIALHNHSAADTALDTIAAPNQPENLRRKAVFWLGVARGRRGYEKLVDILRSDPSDKVREHAIFAMTQSKEPQAIPTIIRVAKEDKSARVRGQALFWLAQSAQKQLASEAITNAIENDPDTEVKRKAVFALSQLPNGEGVTKLIEVAKNNRNAAVRKQAIFWIGQSKDPRALEFIEQVLTR
jgi:HEAT repeat protein